MIESAAILSGTLEKWPDFVVIMVMLILNALLGFFQEFKAGNAIEALKKNSPYKHVFFEREPGKTLSQGFSFPEILSP